MDPVISRKDENENGEEIQRRIQELQVEKEKMQEEFNSQRAKMKDLFLLKEAELSNKIQENNLLKENMQQLKHELDEVKSQLTVESILESNFEEEKRKADEEIATLQRLVHETVEESSSTRSVYDTELVKLQTYIQHLQNEISILKQEKLHSQNVAQEHSLAPSVVLNALTKGIAKKLGADTFSSQDSDDNSKKTQEDVEVLKSLVEPLEDQIKALKEKLRATDEQLQRCRECGHNTEEGIRSANQSLSLSNMQCTSTNTSFDSQRQSEATGCDMCSNYEAQLVKEQKRSSDLEGKVQAAEKAAERHKEELLKEIGFRKEMEEKWNAKKEEHKQQVSELTRATECAELDLKELKQIFNQACGEMRGNLLKLTQERERIYQALDRLQKENDYLVGKYTIHSQELQSEAINLPDTVEELHELVLKNHQELIIAKIGKEAAEAKVNTLQSDIMLLKDQIVNEQHERKSIEDTLDQEIKDLRQHVNQLEKEKKSFTANHETLINSDKASQEKITELGKQIDTLHGTIKQLESRNSELKTRVYSLQQELDTTETVQKDFVRLSQSLQVQLEKIRESDTQVRWQHEEDVEGCPTCHVTFASTKQKQHCRHCGQIFCPNCITRIVPSGPRMRPSKVCDVCHTLLVKSSAPYFSEAPPST